MQTLIKTYTDTRSQRITDFLLYLSPSRKVQFLLFHYYFQIQETLLKEEDSKPLQWGATFYSSESLTCLLACVWDERASFLAVMSVSHMWINYLCKPVYVVNHRTLIKGKKKMLHQAFCRDKSRSCNEVYWSIYWRFLISRILMHKIKNNP